MTDTLTPDATHLGRDRIAGLLAGGGVVDITTMGRRTGLPRRIEITFFNFDGQVYISGLPGRRGWYANLLAEPRFTFHLKRGMALDLRAIARPVTDPDERRAIMTRIVRAWRRDAEFERFLSGSPLIAVDFPPEVAG